MTHREELASLHTLVEGARLNLSGSPIPERELDRLAEAGRKLRELIARFGERWETTPLGQVQLGPGCGHKSVLNSLSEIRRQRAALDFCLSQVRNLDQLIRCYVTEPATLAAWSAGVADVLSTLQDRRGALGTWEARLSDPERLL